MNAPDMPAVANVMSPTPAEQAAIDAALSVYYRVGDMFTYDGPSIGGIAPSPESYSFVLGSNTVDNTKTFTYGASVPASSPGSLANTGLSYTAVLAFALLLVVASVSTSVFAFARK